ncbi:Trk K+ transport system, NAD-binding component [Halovenus aranensis]|uniref:Trk K+ transport system, NAD-binding component n=1 Tax=Halovenus aranensis TaxID=890420 RepID=A0A1G8U9Q6_9EURY|nr:potassium channel protein [Halovenus aranensis]SDJ49740.1 Trk K+ transport system, NAD-binding component [Halovenus aranensis]
MTGWRRRIAGALLGVVGLVVVYTFIYRWSMMTFEGVEITVFESLQVVVEAFTTAGFGGDTQHWNTNAMNAVVVGMNLTGVLLVFLALPLFVVPLFQQALEERPQESTDLTDHVIICSYNSREDVLRSELEAADVPRVVIEKDPETVLELNSDGIEAILGDPESEETFRAANVGQARAVVADVSDEENVPVILTARELHEELDIISVAESAQDAVYHRYAGADRVIRPREALGRSLARKATLSITQELRETLELGGDFELSELLVKPGSELAGQTVAESGLRDTIGATVIGMWTNGEFIPIPEPGRRIDGNSILLVAGSHQQLQQVNSRTIAPKASGDDRVVVAGYGVVGQSVVAELEEAGVSNTVVDAADTEGVDIVGDVNDPETLQKADVDDAKFVVLALDDDTTTMYSTVALEQFASDPEVIARANEVENTTKLYRAGAEYVLALSTVTGRMLSSVLIEEEEVLSPDLQFEIIRTSAPKLEGSSLGETDIGDITGATVVAVERGDELLTNIGPEYTAMPEDTLIVAGSDDAVNEFIRRTK